MIHEEETKEFEQEKIKFKDVKALGFEKEHTSDQVHEDIHGYKAFYVELRIGKFCFSWDTDDRTVEVCKYPDTNPNMKIHTLDQLKDLVDVLKYKPEK